MLQIISIIYNSKLLKMSKMNIQPLADRVLIEPQAAEEKTASGIIIPDTAKEKPQNGKVVMVGSDKTDEPMEIKVGDQVLYGKFAGQELTIDDEDYLLISQSDVLFISK